MTTTDDERLTEERIFEAATEEFIEKGMDGARMETIAGRAGINKSLLHYYFRSKERLFNAVFEKIALKMLKKFAPVLDDNLPLEEKIRFFYREHIGFLQKNPRLPIFLMNEINRHPDRLVKFISSEQVERFRNSLFEHNSEDLEKYHISREEIPQLLTSIVALSIFPFAARGILEGIFQITGTSFDSYIEQRKDFAADFVINALEHRKTKNRKP